MPTSPAFGTPVIGQTEKALNAILARQLAGTGRGGPADTRYLTACGVAAGRIA
jgi:hypothetical protein